MPAQPPSGPTPQDAAAADAVREHHAELLAGLVARVEVVLRAAEQSGGAEESGGPSEQARDDLVGFCRRELIPHALAEETTLYRAGAEVPGVRLLVGAMSAQHEEIVALVDEVRAAPGIERMAAAARALGAVLGMHLGLENDVLLPQLAADPEVSLSEVLARMHREFTEIRTAATST
jgi:hypothetical protein